MNELQRIAQRAVMIGDVVHMMDNHCPGIPWREGALSVNGVDFTLLPTRNVHTEADVRFAKAWLRNNRDCTRIIVQWVTP